MRARVLKDNPCLGAAQTGKESLNPRRCVLCAINIIAQSQSVVKP